jgi:integrase/recombinase XerC
MISPALGVARRSDYAAGRAAVPTFDEYVPQVAQAVSAGTHRVYCSYWERICRHWGSRPISEPTPLEIKRLAEQIRDDVVVRRNARGGRSAAEHLIAAMRCVYRHAVMDGLIREADNPAAKVAKPRRLASTRRVIPDAQLAQITEIVETTGNDPHLDALLLRLHLETACRRGGAGRGRRRGGRPSRYATGSTTSPGPDHHRYSPRRR